jgi:hypothetical protein
MSMLDLIKATLVCGGMAFLAYRFPIVGQVAMIALLGLLWLGYARQTLVSLRRR